MKRNSVSLTFALVTSLVVMFAFGGGFSPLSAGAQEGTPAAGMSGDETFVSVTVPRDQLPAGDGLVVIGRGTFAPGAHQTCTCPDEQGTVITVVESGTFTFELEQGGRIIRGANTASPREEVAEAATRFTLSAGDAIVFPGKKRYEANETTEPATYLFAILIAPAPPPQPDPSDVGERTIETLGVIPGSWTALTSDPVTISFGRATLNAGESLPVPAGGLQAVVSSIAQDPATPTALVPGSDGATTNSGTTSIEVLVVSIEPGSAATPTA